MSWIYLSHRLDQATPLYGGGGVAIERIRRLDDGDTANASALRLPAHAGTHLDAPHHFDAEGKSLDDFPAGFWRCVRPWLIDCPAQPGEILGLARLGEALEAVPPETDLLLLRTGFEAWRDKDPQTYAARGPGLAPEIADWLRRRRQLKILGFDFISVSSFMHREAGRQAHRAFLCAHDSGSAPILLLEDMALARMPGLPAEVWVVPLRFERADGAPVTVLASVDAAT